MKIGFFLMGNAPEHYKIAKLMIESARLLMPNANIFQLTDGQSEAIARPIRLPGDMPMGVRRVLLYNKCEGDWLFIDSDIIFNKDVRDVFRDIRGVPTSDFDLAVTDRIGTSMEGTEYADAMPYNFGVIFSRNTRVWREIYNNLIQLSPKQQEWEGEQLMLAELVKRNQGGKEYNIKILPGKVYNYPPEKKGEDTSHAAIVHFKGPRKEWMQ